MSPFFIKEIKKHTKCPNCKATKATGYSVCEFHLTYARDRWRQWSKERKKEGKCAYCHRKSFNQTLRCRTHTEYNKAICKAWIAKNKDHKVAYDLNRLNSWISLNRCPSCKDHRPLAAPYKRCLDCRIRHRKYKKTSKNKDLRLLNRKEPKKQIAHRK